MVPPAGTPLSAHRLRPLNLPQPVTVEHDPAGRLVAIAGDLASSRREVEAIGEVWRIDDEWWRAPVARCYTELMLTGGGHVLVFHDQIAGTWFLQRP